EGGGMVLGNSDSPRALTLQIREECGGGQERTPLVLLFLRHNGSYLCMQVRRLFFLLAPERDEGTIEIHRRNREQAKEGFLVDQGENVRHPIIRAEGGLGQNQIHPS